MPKPKVPQTVASLEGLGARHKPVKAADQLVRQLVDYIIGEQLAEGTRLPPEREMVAETGRGRSTVREALLLLEAKGVVEVKQGISGGPVVRRPRAADLGEPLTLVLMFDGASMLDVMEARGEIESQITGLAAANISASQLTQLHESIERQKVHIENRDVFLNESRIFHAIINEAGLNVVTRVLLEALQNTTHMTTVAFEYSLSHRQKVINEHVELYEALKAKDGERARKIAKEHVNSGLKYWKKMAGAQASSPLRWSTRLPSSIGR